MRQDLVKCKLDGSSSSGTKPKEEEEEENAPLTSKGHQEQRRKKKDVSQIKYFQCGEFGHYATQCPLKKKGKDKKHDPQAATSKIEEEEFAMIA